MLLHSGLASPALVSPSFLLDAARQEVAAERQPKQHPGRGGVIQIECDLSCLNHGRAAGVARIPEIV